MEALLWKICEKSDLHMWALLWDIIFALKIGFTVDMYQI